MKPLNQATRLWSCPAGEAPEAAATEADFLRSLHQTRQLEAEVHDALAAVLKVRLGECLVHFLQQPPIAAPEVADQVVQ